MRRLTRALGAGIVFALVLAACETDDADGVIDPDPDADPDADEPDDEEPPAAEGGSFSVAHCEPQTLIPQDSRETCGGAIVNQVFSGLLEVDAETGEPELLVAESVETDDNVTWTVTIGDGWTFHDGTPVTVESFVNAWNFGANPDNGFRNVDFYQQIEGFQAVQDGETDELSGVEIIGDDTIQITLSEPFAPFLHKLTDSSFVPLPDVAYDDIEAFNDSPIGNGRYTMDGEWVRGVEIHLAKYEDWPGATPGLADDIEFRIYDDLNTAYLDVQAGALDIQSGIPPERLADADADFDGRFHQTPTSSFTYLGFPMYDDNFGENIELRQALSLAIDRQAIIDTIFDGALTPATAIIPPVLEAHRPDACDVCEFDLERAQQLFDEAGGWDGTMTMYFNSGAGHEEWVEAVANMWRENLGIEDIQFQSLEFAEYLELAAGQELEGPYRLGWVLSYLSPEYALSDLYTSTGGSNYFGYANEAYDEALAEANRADVDAADPLYQQAEDILLTDLPLIPMWYGMSSSVWSERVDNIVVDATTWTCSTRR
jgi:oligopeptide transport system substrate-binding protein